jgi:hypothetical protein
MKVRLCAAQEPFHGEAELGIFYGDFLGRWWLWTHIVRTYFRWRGKVCRHLCIISIHTATLSMDRFRPQLNCQHSSEWKMP